MTPNKKGAIEAPFDQHLFPAFTTSSIFSKFSFCNSAIRCCFLDEYYCAIILSHFAFTFPYRTRYTLFVSPLSSHFIITCTRITDSEDAFLFEEVEEIFSTDTNMGLFHLSIPRIYFAAFSAFPAALITNRLSLRRI